MTFTEDWFGIASCEALATLYERVKDLPGDVVEVGCWEGRSTIALAAACKPYPVQAVDTWNGSPGEVSAELARERDVYATFLANTEGLNITPHRMGWRDYFASHPDPVRFIHIDAEHSYLEVKENIEAVLPLMVSGGVICGDDAHHPPVQQAVLETLGNAYLMATLWWTAV